MGATLRLCLVLAMCTALLVTSASAGTGSGKEAAKPVQGGTFRIALHVNPIGVDSIDPALTSSTAEEMVLRPTCAQLMAFPGPKPEVSAGYPKVSRDRLTYTFTIRPGFRFNTGEPLTAQNFAHAITRSLSPTTRAEGAASWAERFVGGREFHEGKATTLRGVVATRRTLVLRLTRPWPQLLEDLAIPNLGCPVPAALPLDAEGVGAPLPGSGPYYIAGFVPGREVVLARNPLYRGGRPQHVDRFVVDLTSTFETTTRRVAEGKADLAFAAPPGFEELARRYGVNRSQFFVSPSLDNARVLVLNSRRPLFRDNPKLRRAINFAIDRQALAAGLGAVATPTDQFLSPYAAGFRDVRIYPLRGDVRRARALARGHTRSGKAVFYSSELFPFILAQTKLIQESLRQIGIEAEIKTFPHPVFLRKVSTPGEPFDIANSIGFPVGHPDHTVLNCMFHGRWIPPAEGCNYFYFNSPYYNRLLDRAERLVGPARFRLYGRLDVELARDAAPAVPFVLGNTGVLVSKRAGCHRFDRPLLDLATVCLK
ncbi:MAG TPA: ABC transporter substrate-binding protein [Gaiellaceae bacterium]|nr:ABC transporter substrate-binding protein [Gaiellaceae bacterium]